MGGSPLERCSVLPLLWDMVELGYSPADVFVDVGELLADGTTSLIEPMSAGVDIRFGTVVTRVAHDDGGVHVTLDDGTVIDADDRGRRPAGERLERHRVRSAARRAEASGGRPAPPRPGLEGAGGRPRRPGDLLRHGVEHADQRRVRAAARRGRTPVHGLLGAGPRRPGRSRRRGRGGERAPARGRRRHHRRPRLGRRPLLPGDLALGAAHRGSATARSTPWPWPKAGSRSPVPTSPRRAPAGSKARWAVASMPRPTCKACSAPPERHPEPIAKNGAS